MLLDLKLWFVDLSFEKLIFILRSLVADEGRVSGVWPGDVDEAIVQPLF